MSTKNQLRLRFTEYAKGQYHKHWLLIKRFVITKVQGIFYDTDPLNQ